MESKPKNKPKKKKPRGLSTAFATFWDYDLEDLLSKAIKPSGDPIGNGCYRSIKRSGC